MPVHGPGDLAGLDSISSENKTAALEKCRSIPLATPLFLKVFIYLGASTNPSSPVRWQHNVKNGNEELTATDGQRDRREGPGRFTAPSEPHSSPQTSKKLQAVTWPQHRTSRWFVPVPCSTRNASCAHLFFHYSCLKVPIFGEQQCILLSILSIP